MRTRRQGGNKWFTRTFYSKERQLESANVEIKKKFDKIMKALNGHDRVIVKVELTDRGIKDRFPVDWHQGGPVPGGPVPGGPVPGGPVPGGPNPGLNETLEQHGEF
jgi:hypothetical protein